MATKTRFAFSPQAKTKDKLPPTLGYTAHLAAFPINERTRAAKGRFVGNQFVPYHTRSEINAGALDHKAPILGYADDPVELFFLQIQARSPQNT